MATKLKYEEVDGESFMDGLQRMYVMEFLCDVGHSDCVDAGTETFRQWVDEDE